MAAISNQLVQDFVKLLLIIEEILQLNHVFISNLLWWCAEAKLQKKCATVQIMMDLWSFIT